ncbi:MAG: hypothetical protein Q9164_004964 [Protoblastenia rupestris]
MAQPQISLKRQQELQQQYTNYKNNLQQLAQRIGDIEQDAEEHKLVLETLDSLPADRKCFRMINGVLVERVVKDVMPALKTNSEGLKKVLEELVKQYKKSQDEMEKWKVGVAFDNCKGKHADDILLIEEEQNSGCAAMKRRPRQN